jgi:uncharacterized membrane protein
MPRYFVDLLQWCLGMALWGCICFKGVSSTVSVVNLIPDIGCNVALKSSVVCMISVSFATPWLFRLAALHCRYRYKMVGDIWQDVVAKIYIQMG